ncbi:UDP-N-acetylmuramate dehydrogenase [Paraburkholderia sediminicola]|uniref:UDP-N-acetylmuramate dehydrogenase n=1 Tax=Paraburkholderia sediminicola TaxID=458836 RepID=UPI0038BD5F88
MMQFSLNVWSEEFSSMNDRWSNIAWNPALALQPKRHFLLGQCSRFRTGGSADLFFEVGCLRDLIVLLHTLPEDCAVHTTGLGSNTLFRDNGFRGAVIRLIGDFQSCRFYGSTVDVGAGCSTRKLARQAQTLGLGGLEFLDGIPGTVGGSVCMNAGAFGRDMSDVVVEVQVVTRSGHIKHFAPEQLCFEYRKSQLPPNVIIIGARLAASCGEPAAIAERMACMDAERRSYQPIKARTCGSTFKNPPGYSARRLIADAGLQDLRAGGARLAAQNCNFIIAEGRCKSADVEKLGQQVRCGVRQAFGVELEWEIRIVGDAA